jgi:hypothetical protein
MEPTDGCTSFLHTPSMPGLDERQLRAQVLLSVQRALLGEVSSALRGVTVGWQDQVIELRAYFDGPISEDDRESISCVGSEVIADFPDPWTINEEAVRRDAPEPMECLETWAYRRRE